MKRIFIAVLAILLVAGAAYGDRTPSKTSGPYVKTHVLCDAEADPGVCLHSGGDQLVIDTSEYSTFTLSSMQSTATTYACNVFVNDTGYDDAPTPGTGFQINSVALSESQEVISFSAPFTALWINCSAIADNSVTITLVGHKNR